MGSFANTVFSILLGWLQGLISIIWSALTDKGGESFFQFIGDNWIKITLILCAVGLIPAIKYVLGTMGIDAGTARRPFGTLSGEQKTMLDLVIRNNLIA